MQQSNSITWHADGSPWKGDDHAKQNTQIQRYKYKNAGGHPWLGDECAKQ